MNIKPNSEVSLSDQIKSLNQIIKTHERKIISLEEEKDNLVEELENERKSWKTRWDPRTLTPDEKIQCKLCVQNLFAAAKESALYASGIATVESDQQPRLSVGTMLTPISIGDVAMDNQIMSMASDQILVKTSGSRSQEPNLFATDICLTPSPDPSSNATESSTEYARKLLEKSQEELYDAIDKMERSVLIELSNALGGLVQTMYVEREKMKAEDQRRIQKKLKITAEKEARAKERAAQVKAEEIELEKLRLQLLQNHTDQGSATGLFEQPDSVLPSDLEPSSPHPYSSGGGGEGILYPRHSSDGPLSLRSSAKESSPFTNSRKSSTRGAKGTSTPPLTAHSPGDSTPIKHQQLPLPQQQQLQQLHQPQQPQPQNIEINNSHPPERISPISSPLMAVGAVMVGDSASGGVEALMSPPQSPRLELVDNNIQPLSNHEILSDATKARVIKGDTFYVSNFFGIRSPRYFFISVDAKGIGWRNSATSTGNQIIMPFTKFES